MESVCNSVFADKMLLPQSRIEERGDDSKSPDCKFGIVVFCHKRCVCTTRHDDLEWSNLVNLVISTFYSAEAANFNKENAEDLYLHLSNNTDLASTLVSSLETLATWMLKVLRGGCFPVKVWTDFTTAVTLVQDSCIFSFLEVWIVRDQAQKQTELMKQSSTKTDFCVVFVHLVLDLLPLAMTKVLPLGLALMSDGKDKVPLVNTSAPNGMYALLNAGEVDLVAGARVTLEASYHEPTTGNAYTFSMPYFCEQGCIYYEDTTG